MNLAYHWWRLRDRLRLPVSENPPLPRDARRQVWAPIPEDPAVLSLLSMQMGALAAHPGTPEAHAALYQRHRILSRLTPAQRCHAATLARSMVELLS